MAKPAIFGGSEMQMMMMMFSQMMKGQSSDQIAPFTRFQNSVSNIFTRIATDPSHVGEDNARLDNVGSIIQELHDKTVKQNPKDSVGMGMINDEAQKTIQGLQSVNREYDEFTKNYLTGGTVVDKDGKTVKIPSFRDRVVTTWFNDARGLSKDIMELDSGKVDITTDEGKQFVRNLNKRRIKWQTMAVDIMRQQDTYENQVLPKFKYRANYESVKGNITNTGKTIEAVWDEMKGKTLFTQEEHKAIQEGHASKKWQAYDKLESRQAMADQSLAQEHQTKINQTAKQIQIIENAMAMDVGRATADGKKLTDTDLIYGFEDNNLTRGDAKKLIRKYNADILDIRAQMERSGETYPHTKFEDVEKIAGTILDEALQKELDDPTKITPREIRRPATTIKQDRALMQQFKINPAKLDSHKVAFAKQDKHKTLEAFIGASKETKTKKVFNNKTGIYDDIVVDTSKTDAILKDDKVDDKVDDKSVDKSVGSIIEAHSKVYKSGFFRSPEGKKFAKEHGLDNWRGSQIMTTLQSIESTRRNYKNKDGTLSSTGKDLIKSKEEWIAGKLKKIESVKQGKIKDKIGVPIINKYVKGAKLSTEESSALKKAIPDIDTHIEKWKDATSGVSFTVWMRRQIDAGKIDEINYEEFQGLL